MPAGCGNDRSEKRKKTNIWELDEKEKFSVCAASILVDLYECFPAEKRISGKVLTRKIIPADIRRIDKNDNPLEGMEDDDESLTSVGHEFNKFSRSVLEWLSSNNYIINKKNSYTIYDGGEYILSEKGMAFLNEETSSAESEKRGYQLRNALQRIAEGTGVSLIIKLLMGI